MVPLAPTEVPLTTGSLSSRDIAVKLLACVIALVMRKKNAPRGRVMILQFAIALAIGIYVVLSKDVERTTPHESLPPLQRTGHRFDRDSGLESDFAKVDLDGVLLLMSREIPVVASICEIAFEAVPPSRKIRCQNRPRAIIPRRPTTGGKSRGRICPRQRQSVGASARKQSTHP